MTNFQENNAWWQGTPTRHQWGGKSIGKWNATGCLTVESSVNFVKGSVICKEQKVC